MDFSAMLKRFSDSEDESEMSPKIETRTEEDISDDPEIEEKHEKNISKNPVDVLDDASDSDWDDSYGCPKTSF